MMSQKAITMKHLLLLIVLSISFSACNKSKTIRQEKEIAQLQKELDECVNGPDKLLSQFKYAIDQNDKTSALTALDNLKERHGSSAEYTEGKTIWNDWKAEQEEAKAAKKAEQEKALNSLRKEHDDVSGVTWYYQKYFTHYNNTNAVSMYIGTKPGREPWIRLKMSYKGDDWIFFDNVYLSYDGNTTPVAFQRDEKNSDNSGGEVWEFIDIPGHNVSTSYLRKFCESNDAKVRYSGKYQKDRKLSSKQKKGLLDVLNAFEAMTTND